MNQNELTQYRFEADAILIDSTTQEEKTFHESTWRNMHSDLRHILWQEYLGDKKAPYDVNQVFPCHANVLLKPCYWDIFKLGIDDFAKSERMQMILKNGQWEVFERTPRICPLELVR